MKQSIIALIDCNSFYCSCERLFRPDLIRTPVGVLSNNDGCFVSRTREFKKLGIPMGAPYFKYKDLCIQKKVGVFSANFSLYTNLSSRVMNYLKNFSPVVEVYSVDEAFLDLKGFKKEDLLEYGRHIKETVERNTGIPVSIGIAPTKALAKLANYIGKKEDGHKGVVCAMDKISQDSILKRVGVRDIWGVGRKNSVKLKALGIKTAKDFRDYKNDKLIQKIFTKVGRQVQDELRGQVCFPITTEIEKKKEIISSRTFGRPVYDLHVLKEAIANYASLACEKLRAQNSVCSSIEVWVRTNPFKEVPQYYAVKGYKFQTQTSDTRKVIKEAWKLLDEIYEFGYEYKKALIKLSGIRDKEETQFSFFDLADSIQDENLMVTMDKINLREGPQTLKSLACGTSKEAWRMNQVFKSPRYVTGWGELRKVY